MKDDNAGEPARQTGRFKREVIGPTDCPIMIRWTLLSTRWGKLMLHHFLPNADDRATHDHPSPFVTLVLRGGYDDLVPCEPCDGDGWLFPDDPCMDCMARGEVVGDRMRPGMVRYRRAEYAHRTRVLPSGAWTIVLMGPKQREWGFFKEGRWWPWREHERRFGYGMRCPEDGGKS